MAESETIILLAVFADISSADHAVDMLWEWSESLKGQGPDAVGVLVNQHNRLDAQLIGDDSGYGEETGLSLDIFEILLASEKSGDLEIDQDFQSAADTLTTLLGLDNALIKRLRGDLSTGQALLLLVPNHDDLPGAQEQLETLGGQITLLEIPRATLFRAAALMDEDELDEDFDFDEEDPYGEYEGAYNEDDDANDFYDEDSSYEDDDFDGPNNNGRYR
ncbi:MAG: hypothetical protein ACK2U0_07420 [Candidatus Promineifilaceae bacterium]|jgi:hypothetical protein